MFHHELASPEELAQIEDVCKRLAGAVRESIDMLRGVMNQIEQSPVGQRRDVAVPLLLSFDFIEAIDGVALLAERGSAQNCNVLLRSAYELQLAIVYLTADPAESSRRALAYEWFHHKDQLRWAERVDPTTDYGKQLHAEMAGAPHTDVLNFGNNAEVNIGAEVERRKRILAADEYADVRAEYDRMKAAKTKVNEWYSLWDGPQNIRELAKRTTGLPIYEALYRSWSGVAHGSRAIGRFCPGEGGKTMLQSVRSPTGLPKHCLLAVTLTNGVSLLLVDKLVPEFRLALKQRYIGRVRPARLYIESITID